MSSSRRVGAQKQETARKNPHYVPATTKGPDLPSRPWSVAAKRNQKRIHTGVKACICDICSCGVHRCPEQKAVLANYKDVGSSLSKDSFTGEMTSQNVIVGRPKATRPVWAETGHFEGGSTSRQDFAGHWGATNERVQKSQAITVDPSVRFEGTSTSRGDFQAFTNLSPRKRVDPRSQDQLKFEWNDNAPMRSTMRGDFKEKTPEFCPVRAIKYRPHPQGGHVFFVKDKQGRFHETNKSRPATAKSSARNSRPASRPAPRPASRLG